jgi:hypothetical protein
MQNAVLVFPSKGRSEARRIDIRSIGPSPLGSVPFRRPRCGVRGVPLFGSSYHGEATPRWVTGSARS